MISLLMALFLTCCLMTPLASAGAMRGQQPAPAAEYDSQDQNAAAGQEIEIKIKGVKVKIPDLVLRDQEGRKVRFYSDLIKGKIVVLTFFYTSCTYTCTMQGRTFSKLQSLLGERLGKSVFLISVTTDPVGDTPEKLKAWAMRYNVKPGWTLVTGDQTEMNKLLIPFTGNSAGGGMHLPVTFIGNDTRGLWTSAAGVFAPEDLLKAVDFTTTEK
jgi:cytochrome oxidase Cu insertion factor (SCO1/SenC/PrrC family)